MDSQITAASIHFPPAQQTLTTFFFFLFFQPVLQAVFLKVPRRSSFDPFSKVSQCSFNDDDAAFSQNIIIKKNLGQSFCRVARVHQEFISELQAGLFAQCKPTPTSRHPTVNTPFRQFTAPRSQPNITNQNRAELGASGPVSLFFHLFLIHTQPFV